MNVESIKARIEALTAQARLLEQNLQAIGGAIQDCQFWLTQLEQTNAPDSINDSQGAQGQH
jgi:prefoldin subunit 5